MRDYSLPLTIVLTGSGKSDALNTESLLGDFMFGNVDGDVDVRVIVPYSGKTAASLADALKILKAWGIDGKDFIPVVEPNSGHGSISSAKETIQVDQGDSISRALQLLGDDMAEGRDVAFISLYAEGNVKDLDEIDAAKSCEGLTTLNLCEGLIDSFPGYESEADRVIRESLQEAFAEQEAAKEEAAPKPAKKTAAKKAVTPRTRATSKPLVQEDQPLTDEPQKAPEKPLTGTKRLVAEAVQREADKKAARKEVLIPVAADATEAELRELEIKYEIAGEEIDGFVRSLPALTELSGTIVMGSAKLPEALEPARSVAPVVDVWQDVANNLPTASGTHISVAKEDLVQLNEGMQEMARGFSTVLDAYNRMLKEQ